ncbi:hypothetical protein N9777_09915 [Ascidiaceihabitans sp.]|nr:hypothetical protein [Ascidiaceihabitans sp.]
MQDFMLYLAFYGLIVVIVILAQVLVAAQQVGLSTLAGNREDLVLTGLAGRMERAANNSLLALELYMSHSTRSGSFGSEPLLG